MSRSPRFSALLAHWLRRVVLAAVVGLAFAVSAQAAPPSITSQPSELWVQPGDRAGFAVTAAGTAPFTYQWYRDGVALPGATSDVLLWSDAKTTDIGRYHVVVSNAEGYLSTTPVELHVRTYDTDVVDTAFRVTADLAKPHGIVVQPDGKPILLGSLSGDASGSIGPGLVRLNTDGSIDTTFQAKNAFLGTGVATAAFPLADGRLYAGVTLANSTNRTLRLKNDGTVDPTFPALTNGALVGVDGDTLIVVRDGHLVRLLADGSIDPSFQNTTRSDSFSVWTPIQVIVTGKGYYVRTGSISWRINRDGSEDTAFGTVTDSLGTRLADDSVVTAEISHSTPLILPIVTTYAYLMKHRKLSDGTRLSLTTNAVEWVTIHENESTPTVWTDPSLPATVGCPDGTFLLVGSQGVRRFKADGSRDHSFNQFAGSDQVPTVHFVGLNPNGTMAYVPCETAFNGHTTRRIARVRLDRSAPQPPVLLKASIQGIIKAVGPTTYTASLLAVGDSPLGGYTSTTPETTLPFDGTPTPISMGSTYLGVRNLTFNVASTRYVLASYIRETQPAWLTSPASQTVIAGTEVTFRAELNAPGETVAYQWSFNGVPVTAGVSGGTLTIPAATAADAGTYTVTATTPTRSATAYAVLSLTTGSFLRGLSVRAKAQAGDGALIIGFITRAGTADKPVVVRAISDALSGYGLTPGLGQPRVTIHAGDALIYSRSADTALQQSLHLPPTTGADQALRFDASDGAYTAVITSDNAQSGYVLGEIYDATPNQTTRLTALSARARVGTGDAIAIAGLRLQGDAPRRLLIRAVGPGLSDFGVSDILADPQIAVVDASGAVIATNDNWETGNDVNALMSATAYTTFSLKSGSKDAALLVSLEPGNYTVLTSGVKQTSGIVLLEVYEKP